MADNEIRMPDTGGGTVTAQRVGATEAAPHRTADSDRAADSSRAGLSQVETRADDPTRSIADPGALGLGAFAMTTFLLSIFNAGLVSNSKLEAVVLPLALFYGGAVQLLAGMWEFKKANTFGATAFSSFGAFWLAYAAYVKFVVPGLPAGDAHTATALFLLAWGIFTAYMLIASVRVSVAVAAVFAFLTATFFVLAAGVNSGNTSTVHIGGYLGLITAILAWYASFAIVTNATWGRTVLPTLPAEKH